MQRKVQSICKSANICYPGMAADHSLLTIIYHLNLRQNNPLGLDPFISEESFSNSDHYLGILPLKIVLLRLRILELHVVPWEWSFHSLQLTPQTSEAGEFAIPKPKKKRVMEKRNYHFKKGHASFRHQSPNKSSCVCKSTLHSPSVQPIQRN